MNTQQINTHPDLKSFLVNTLAPHVTKISKVQVTNEQDFMEMREAEDESSFDRLSEMMYLNH